MTCCSCSLAYEIAGNSRPWPGMFATAGVQPIEIRCRIAQSAHQEICMNKFAIRLLTLAMLSLTLVAAPVVTVVYAQPDNDPPPPEKGKKKKSSEAQPGSQQTAFADGYRAAYATIYDRHEYASAIEQLKALGRDDSAAVANLNHVKTWQYYGLWQVEQGNRDQAQYHLNRIASLSGTASEEYRSLAAALEKPPGTGLVY